MPKSVVKVLAIIFGAAVLFGFIAPSPLVAFLLTLGAILVAAVYLAAKSFLAFLDERE